MITTTAATPATQPTVRPLGLAPYAIGGRGGRGHRPPPSAVASRRRPPDVRWLVPGIPQPSEPFTPK